MKIIQIALDDDIAAALERVCVSTRVVGDSFVNDALRTAVNRQSVPLLERRHREGYERHPVEPGELVVVTL